MGNLISVNQLSTLTGKDRRTISTRLDALPFEAGDKGAHLYDSVLALGAIYAPEVTVKSLDQARTELAIEQTQQVRVKREELQRERIPHDVIDLVECEVFQAIAAALKNAKDKLLTEELINSIFAAFREQPARRTQELARRG